MTRNDTQIDVLIRRYVRHAKRVAATDHLDADELNAFAESKLPPAARARCLSHLADCEGCRKIVAQLSATSEAGMKVAQVTLESSSASGLWWQRLASLFAPPILRYAAFAVVLMAVGSAIFLTLRRPRESALVARNEQTTQVSEVKAPESVASNNQADSANRSAATSSEAAQNSNLAKKQDESKTAENLAPPKPEQETRSSGANPSIGKTQESPVAEATPSYAPPPPGERGEVTAREEREVRRAAEEPRPPGPIKSTDDKSKATDQIRAGELAKDRRTENENQSVDQPSTGPSKGPARSRAPRSETAGVAAMSGNKRTVTESEKQDTQNAGRASAGASSETRTVGGHKFRRQGNVWVDAKYKPSMPVINIARGSDEFRALNSGLRSISEQLGGEVIVVSKGKAYRIR